MGLALWIRAALSRSDKWCGELERLRAAVAAEATGAAKTERTLDLAEACEHVDPDRTKALALYVAAWRGGHLAARTSVLALARELRAYVTLAEVAIADHADTQDPEALVTAGRAFLDAGLVERATEIFAKAAKQHVSLADAIATTPRLADVRVVLARTRFQKLDPEHEIETAMSRAQQSGDGGGSAYVIAARIARFAKLDRYAVILGLAARSCPGDDDVARLFEDTLLDGKNADDFLLHHRRRLEAMRGEAAWIECVRAAACELVLRDVHPGLGLRMLRTSLEHAYAAREPVRRHVAAWELLVAAARSSRSTVSLAPLLADALRAPLPPDDALYTARLGLEVTWRDARDPVAAQPYAAALLDHVPGHPLAAAFLSETLPVPPPSAEPVLPTVTFKIPVIKRDVSPIPTPPPPPPDATARAVRKVVPVDVVIELPTGAFFSAVLRDLSATGAFVTTKRALEVGTVVSLEIRLPSSRDLAEQHFRIDARIARRTDAGCGLAFIAPPPELVAGIAALIVG